MSTFIERMTKTGSEENFAASWAQIIKDLTLC